MNAVAALEWLSEDIITPTGKNRRERRRGPAAGGKLPMWCSYTGHMLLRPTSWNAPEKQPDRSSRTPRLGALPRDTAKS